MKLSIARKSHQTWPQTRDFPREMSSSTTQPRAKLTESCFQTESSKKRGSKKDQSELDTNELQVENPTFVFKNFIFAKIMTF